MTKRVNGCPAGEEAIVVESILSTLRVGRPLNEAFYEASRLTGRTQAACKYRYDTLLHNRHSMAIQAAYEEGCKVQRRATPRRNTNVLLQADTYAKLKQYAESLDSSIHPIVDKAVDEYIESRMGGARRDSTSA